MSYYLIITALTVSIDSFVCGFSLSCYSKRKITIVLGIALTVFLMCLIANYLSYLFIDKITEKTASLGGLILVGIGIFNLIKKEKQQTLKHGAIKQSIITGFAVGLDGATANLSLSLMGINSILTPVTIALCHALLIWLGILLANVVSKQKFAKIGILSPIILILLGGYKLLGLFI